MAEVEHAGVRIHYELSGREQGDALVFGNSLGSNLHIWDRILPCFEARYRVVRFDLRGHGRSSVPPGPYSMEGLGRDVLSLLDSLGLERVNYCGISLGGMLGTWLGIYAPQRVRRLILANTGARIGSRVAWEERIALVRNAGMAAVAESTPARWFTADYREEHPEEMMEIRRMVGETDPEGYAGCCAALRETDLRGELASISTPCLVIVGKHDPATPPSDGAAIHRGVRNSKYVELDASHLSAWERAAEFGAQVAAFLETGEIRHG